MENILGKAKISDNDPRVLRRGQGSAYSLGREFNRYNKHEREH